MSEGQNVYRLQSVFTKLPRAMRQVDVTALAQDVIVEASSDPSAAVCHS